MQESHLPKYYICKYFRKVDRPFLVFPVLIIFINFVEGLAFIFAKGEIVAFKDYIILLLSNSFFSITSLFLLVIIYEKNVTKIDEWLELNNTVINKQILIKDLNRYHSYLFGKYQIICVIFILVFRRIICWVYFPVVSPIFGYIINDTITVFLLTSLALGSRISKNLNMAMFK